MVEQRDIDRVKKKIQDVSARVSALEGELNEQLRLRDREIQDWEAPRCGERWSPFEHENLEDAFKDFVYDRAKRCGRSTSAIRHRVAKMIAPMIDSKKWCDMRVGFDRD